MRLRALLASAALLASPLTVLTLPAGAAQAAVPAAPITCQDLPRAAGQMTCLSEVGAPVSATSVPSSSIRSSTDGRVTPLAGTDKSGSYAPADIASMYGLPGGAGAGAVVAVIEAGRSSAMESNLQTYRTRFGQPACTKANGCLREVNQAGGSALPAPVTGWDFEINMDVQAVSAACPACRILVVDAASDYTSDLAAAVQTAVNQGASYVSMSYGSPEPYRSQAAAADAVFANNPGVTFVASTGDSGYAGGTSFPASSTHVVAAGGTSVREVGGVWQHTAWDQGGSGCSAYSTMPSAQLGAPGAVTACGSKRATSDLSALADASTGMLVYQGGTWWNGGGTSLSAPLIAAMYALAGNHTDPFGIYARAASLTDVTSGSTGTCTIATRCVAGPGWDGPTGLGTPYGLGAFSFAGVTAAPVRVAPPAPVPTPTSSPAPTPHRFTRQGALRVRGQVARGRSVRAAYGTFRADTLLGPHVSPEVRITWMLDGRVVKGAHRPRLHVRRGWKGKHLSFRLTVTAPGFVAASFGSRPTGGVR